MFDNKTLELVIKNEVKKSHRSTKNSYEMELIVV
jgi:hypothetical protein